MSLSSSPASVGAAPEDFVDLERAQEATSQDGTEERGAGSDCGDHDDEEAPLARPATPALPVIAVALPAKVTEAPAKGSGEKDAKPQGKTLYPEVDVIKAIGIMTVVLIHSLPLNFTKTPVAKVDDIIGHCSRFAVPGFLACSGYLFATVRSEDHSFSMTWKRLQRLLIPYLVFSVPAWRIAEVVGWHQSVPDVIWGFLTCSELGPYYYVFVITYLVLATPLIARIPQRFLPLLTGVAIVVHFLCEAGLAFQLPLYWQLRNPARSLGPFLFGWCTMCFRNEVLRNVQKRHHITSCLLCVLVVLLIASIAVGLEGSRLVLVSIETVLSYSVIMLLFSLGCAQSSSPFIIRWLSNASYTIYLSHYFFIFVILDQFEHTPGAFEPLRTLACWSGSLCASVAVVIAARAVLGPSLARRLLG